MGQTAVTRNLTGNPVQRSDPGVTPVKARLNRRQRQPAYAGYQAGPKTGEAAGSFELATTDRARGNLDDVSSQERGIENGP